jgi:NADPH-dependent ferric siderophore reductase
MRRIQLTSPTLDAFEYLPGQDLALGFQREGATVRRRYTIRRFDPVRRLLDLEFVMHGDGPGVRWAGSARPGVSIEAIGPRGKITLAPAAGWHLFAGDATAVPGAFAMMEALPADLPADACLEVDGPDERQLLAPGQANKTVSWHYEGDQPGLLGDVSAAGASRASRHAYLAGEVAVVTALKDTLIARGWSADQISAKAYWNRGRANAGHGEPEQKA